MGFTLILLYKLWPIRYKILNEIIIIVLSKFELYKSMILFVSTSYSLTVKAR